jgi:uncharacterized protein (DUF362 family)
MNRRTFLKKAAEVGGLAFASSWIPAYAETQTSKKVARVAFVKTNDRALGVSRVIDLFSPDSFKNKDLFIKPNFNSADPTPGSTHIDTLNALVGKLRKMGAGPLTIGDRSGMGNTRAVLKDKGVFKLADEQGLKTIVFDELEEDQWNLIRQKDTHWERGFALPVPVQKASGIISTCCLKTHRYGGHFTLSLKNSVGLAAKYVPGDSYSYMSELHSSPYQRAMIAEINAAYLPDLVVLDGVEAFTNGGPDSGRKVQSSVMLAGTDRVAIDAVGVAILRHFGTTEDVSRGAIFDQDQIKRAVALGVGIDRPDRIELVTDDPESAAYAKTIRNILDGKA